MNKEKYLEMFNDGSLYDYIVSLENRITKSHNIIDKFKETYIICFDKDLWGFVKRLEKSLGDK